MEDIIPGNASKYRESKKAYRKRHKALGLCVVCTRPAIKGKTLCEIHRFKTSKSQKKNYTTEKRHARMVAYADRHRMAGLCANCGRPAIPGYVNCEKHSKYYRAKSLIQNPIRRKQYAESGRCVRCSVQLEDGEGKTCVNCSGRIQFNKKWGREVHA